MSHAKLLSPEEWVRYSELLSTKISKALVKSGETLSLNQIDAEILRNESVAFGVFDGGKIKCVLVGKYIKYTPELTVFFVTLGAGELTRYTGAIQMMHDIVKQAGAKYVELWAGEAEARLYARSGYRMTCLVLRKTL